MALAETALTTVAKVRDLVGTAYTDALIEQRITSVSARIDSYVGRALARAEASSTHPEFYRGNGRPSLWLLRWPVIAVTQVKVDGSVITDYEDDRHLLLRGELYRAAGWPIRCARHSDLTQDVDLSVQGYPVSVAYIAGYQTPNQTALDEEVGTDVPLPPDLEQVCVDEVVSRLTRPNSQITRERTPGGWERTFGSSSQGGASTGSWLAESIDVLECYRQPRC